MFRFIKTILSFYPDRRTSSMLEDIVGYSAAQLTYSNQIEHINCSQNEEAQGNQTD